MKNLKLNAVIITIGLGALLSACNFNSIFDPDVGRVDLIVTSNDGVDAGKKLRWQLEVPPKYVVSRSGPKGIRFPNAVRGGSQKIVLRGMIDPVTYLITPYVQKGTRQGYSFEMKTSNWVRGQNADLFQGCLSNAAYHKGIRPKSTFARECRNKGYCPYMIGKGRWMLDVSLRASLKDDPLVCEALDTWLDQMTLSIDDDTF